MLISLSLVLIAVVMTMLAPSPSAASARSAGTHYSNSEHSVFVTDLHGISGRAACIVEHKLYDWLGKPHHKLSRCTAVDGKPILVTHSWEGGLPALAQPLGGVGVVTQTHVVCRDRLQRWAGRLQLNSANSATFAVKDRERLRCGR